MLCARKRKSPRLLALCMLFVDHNLRPSARSLSVWHRNGINMSIISYGIKFALQVLGETGDVFRLLEQRAALGHFPLLIAEAPECSQRVIGIQVNPFE